jgi:hypothetical protein
MLNRREFQKSTVAAVTAAAAARGLPRPRRYDQDRQLLGFVRRAPAHRQLRPSSGDEQFRRVDISRLQPPLRGSANLAFLLLPPNMGNSDVI